LIKSLLLLFSKKEDFLSLRLFWVVMNSMPHGFAPAKINLHLHVTGRRADGYHLLDSLVVFANTGDEIAFAGADDLSLTIVGPEHGALSAEPDNLVLRAARKLAQAAGITPLGRLTLTKNLPVASGIGGGSADAAATLRLLAQAWKTEADLPALAAGLGADVPACVASRSAVMQGIGEILRPAPQIPELGILLANPRVALPTAAVFKARSGPYSEPARLPAAWPDARAMAGDLAKLANDLEAPAIGLCPPVAEVLAALRALPGVLLARMSGSGATCFALFETQTVAANAAASLPDHWWRWGGGLYEPPQRL
jgi:4-diphosphocytidyl-2-C-methyl-D-erythritol kinase